MTADALRCRCGREVRIVRLNRRTLALGHVTNPGPDSHPVRLAPAARNAFPEATEQPEPVGSSRSGARSAGRAVPRVSMPDHLSLREQAVSTPASPGARLHGLLGPGQAHHRRG